MVLVDTSVWIQHLRPGNVGLEKLLNDSSVACHPFVIGELTCGNLSNKAEILTLLEALPMAAHVEHEEVLRFIGDNSLMGKRLGYIDMHLMASALLTNVPLWTQDKRLDNASCKLGVSY